MKRLAAILLSAMAVSCGAGPTAPAGTKTTQAVKEGNPCWIDPESKADKQQPQHPPCDERVLVTPTAPRVRPTPRVIVR